MKTIKERLNVGHPFLHRHAKLVVLQIMKDVCTYQCRSQKDTKQGAKDLACFKENVVYSGTAAAVVNKGGAVGLGDSADINNSTASF